MNRPHITTPSNEMDLSDTQKAYLAGLIDGDGSIFLSYYKYPTRKRGGIHSIISCAVSVRSANKEYAQEVLQMMRGKVGRVEENYFEVIISRQADILQFIEAILPYLRLKRKEAEIMIEFCRERLRDLRYRRNAPYTAKCFELVDEMKALHNVPMHKREWK